MKHQWQFALTTNRKDQSFTALKHINRHPHTLTQRLGDQYSEIPIRAYRGNQAIYKTHSERGFIFWNRNSILRHDCRNRSSRRAHHRSRHCRSFRCNCPWKARSPSGGMSHIPASMSNLLIALDFGEVRLFERSWCGNSPAPKLHCTASVDGY